MSPKIESPVQTQMAVAALNRSLSSDYQKSHKSEGKPKGRRRIFVQTDKGCVMGIELDRGDNAQTVKRKLQVALSVPTEESSLTYGDLVLKNDLSAIRNDAPVLLSRNMIHRSSSTPCLSPTAKDLQQRDQSGPIEVLGLSSSCSRTKQLVKDVVDAIQKGVDPRPINGGLGGAYYFMNSCGENVAIVKPTDEEPLAPNNPKGWAGKALGQPGLKKSVRVGETGFREVAAYLLDHENFANVPPTALVKITHSVFHVNDGVNYSQNSKAPKRKQQPISKIASFQQYIPHDSDASDYGTSSFPVAAVHRIGILDVRIFNMDRHGGNILVRKLNGGCGRFGTDIVELFPIDHGLCLPETLEDPYFEWIHWPQASVPFSEDELKYITDLDPFKDSEMLRVELPMIREACLRILVLCTIFLKEAAASGLCLSEIGKMMSREFRKSDDKPSELELLCIEARRLMAKREFLPPAVNPGYEDESEVQFEIDCEVIEHTTPRTPLALSFSVFNAKNPFSKLECLEEGEEDDASEENSVKEKEKLVRNLQNLSTSLKGVSLIEKSRSGGVVAGNSSNNISAGGAPSQSRSGRSANEQQPSSVTFVKFSDMDDDQWACFLELFRGLLEGAFRSHRMENQKQRLGTSCKF